MGRITSFVIERWKLLLNIATVIALIILIYAIRGDIVTTIENLFQVHAWVLLLIIPIEALNYHAQTKLYQGLFKIVGNNLSYKYLFLASLELNFVNHVFPSGGAAGLSYFSVKLRSNEVSGAKATLIQILKLVLTIFSFESLIFLSIIFIAIGGHVNSFTMLVAGILSTLLLVLSLLFIYIIGNQGRIKNFLEYVTKRLNQLIHFFRPSENDAINMDRARLVFDDFHDTYVEVKNNRSEIQTPLLYALLANVTEIAVVYVVFIAFGHFVNVGSVILAYGIANFAGAVSILPGGIGIYEALMTAVLLATGISPKLSLPVIIMYRVLNTLLQVPPGYYLYQRSLSRRKQQRTQKVGLI